MAPERPVWLLLLWLGCSGCLGLGHLVGDMKRHEEAVLPAGDTVSEHMLRLYDRYRGDGGKSRDAARHQLPLHNGNTVRSFRALSGDTDDGSHHIFNLTSLTSSENILSATFHYYLGDMLNNSLRCPHSPLCLRRVHRKHELSILFTVSSIISHENQTKALGHFFINISSSYRDIPFWQWKDITEILRDAKHNGETVIGINLTIDTPTQHRKHLLRHKPYILVYANDSAISEPDSVVSNLHVQHSPIVHKPHHKAGLFEHRSRRSTDILLPLQNNELPGAEYQYNEDEERWEEKKPYKTLHVKLAEKGKSKKKLRKSGRQKSQTLQFDEQTLKKARRKQWNEPRNCARRYLKVDFADIGWSEWIISPKSFDAYYCSGACQFPMPKSLKPSNHATIQSIVRAVGVVPGIPEPCCVPEKMSSLSILFFDENKNVVLKVYPNMTVESCACR
ncbi:bone morphogenetic protein 3 [Dendropsophus ebraccatus]|uniref:bone morphogenetic protein 3 n=1 Tax=Dendropsophus ebraccatus TaxID=150705 RepID=UPI0038314D18